MHNPLHDLNIINRLSKCQSALGDIILASKIKCHGLVVVFHFWADQAVLCQMWDVHTHLTMAFRLIENRYSYVNIQCTDSINCTARRKLAQPHQSPGKYSPLCWHVYHAALDSTQGGIPLTINPLHWGKHGWPTKLSPNPHYNLQPYNQPPTQGLQHNVIPMVMAALPTGCAYVICSELPQLCKPTQPLNSEVPNPSSPPQPFYP